MGATGHLCTDDDDGGDEGGDDGDDGGDGDGDGDGECWHWGQNLGFSFCSHFWCFHSKVLELLFFGNCMKWVSEKMFWNPSRTHLDNTFAGTVNMFSGSQGSTFREASSEADLIQIYFPLKG